MMYAMHRTTVYLPEPLRDKLASAAREDRRTEADLIREGVERVLRERSLPDQPPEPRLPLVDSGHPGLGLALDWFFQDAPTETLDWLVAQCVSVWAQQVGSAESRFTICLSFRDAHDNEGWLHGLEGADRSLPQTWADACWSLEKWLVAVMDGRERSDRSEVLVLRKWQQDRPPLAGEAPLEIAHVEVGPRVGGPPAGNG